MRDADELREERQRTVSQRTVAWLTAVGLLGAAGIFGLGFVIGGRMARLDIAHEPMIDPIARLDVQRKLHDELTFYDDLTAQQKTRAVAAPVEALKAAAPTLTPHAKAASGQMAPPAGAVAPVKISAGAPAPGAQRTARVLTPAPAPIAKAAAQRAVEPSGLHNGPARAGEYTVQVSSYQSHEEARAFCAALERKGLKPFVIKTDLGPRGTWFRVRVGRFVDEAQAKQAKQTLAQSDIPSWVLRTE